MGLLALIISVIALIVVVLTVKKLNASMKRTGPNAADGSIPIGHQGCTVDWDCQGWSFFGDVACCNTMCVEKQDTFQTCDDYCKIAPENCTPVR